MNVILIVVFAIVGIYFTIEAIAIAREVQSAIHQIYVVLNALMAILAFGFASILSALNSLKVEVVGKVAVSEKGESKPDPTMAKWLTDSGIVESPTKK